MEHTLLVEIGTEEIPSGYIPGALEAWKERLAEELRLSRISHGGIKVFGTPRRLALMVESVKDKQEDLTQKVIGPPRQVSYDKDGNPTRAAIGFARAHGLSPEDLQIEETEKGEYLCAIKKVSGDRTISILQKVIPETISRIPFPKSMRWMDLDVRFARPIHWIVALFGRELIPFRFGNVESGRYSRGHRFIAPRPILLEEAGDYPEACRNAHVIADPEERKEVVRREIGLAAERVSGKVVEDKELLESVTYLVEYPSAICGSFDPEFLELPREVLITSMREHQRYFSVVDREGRLLPHFVAVLNTPVEDIGIVRSGNERVLRARLSDARFYFREDLKRPLHERTEDLKHVVFHSRLGTSYEKVMRFQALAVYLADTLAPELKDKVSRAAFLCKADLTTGMVGEFPSLQGVMGREYGMRWGEDEEVCTAIHEHYLPSFSGDRLPSSAVAALVGLADRMDTIAGCFAVGLVPSGTADPYALRRQALGIIHILLDRDYQISLRGFVEKSLELLGDLVKRDREELLGEILSFFKVRFQGLLRDQGYAFNIVEAVLSTSFDNLPDAARRIKALKRFTSNPGFEDLALSFKRVLNIIGDHDESEVEASALKDTHEIALYQLYEKESGKIKALIEQNDYEAALEKMAALREGIDGFFDHVLVNVDEERVRRNRLSLLRRFAEMFLQVADFSKITTR